jgi:hypothetical protein
MKLTRPGSGEDAAGALLRIPVIVSGDSDDGERLQGAVGAKRR